MTDFTAENKERDIIYKAVTQFIAEQKEEYRSLKGDQEKGTIQIKFQQTDAIFNRAVDAAEKQPNSGE